MNGEVIRLFEELAIQATPSAPWRWELSVGKGKAARRLLRGRARRNRDWLVVEFDDPEAKETTDPEVLLRRNARLDGMGKLVLSPGEKRPLLRAEVPIPALESWLEDEAEASRAGLARALDALAGSDPEACDPVEATATDLGASLLETATAESGWAARWSSEGTALIELGGDGTCPATLCAHGHGFRAGVDLADPDVYEVAGRRALAVLLLTAAAAVRLVRPVARDGDGRRRVGFEVSDSRPATPASVDRALSALALAVGLVGRETSALAARSIAETYLARQGWTP